MVRAPRDSASLAIVDGRVVGWSALSRGQPRQFDEPLAPGTIAPELDAAAVATLPLESVTNGTLDVLGAFGGVNRRLVTVVGPDTLDAAGRVRDCWVVRVWSGVETEAKVTMWIDRRTRRVWQQRGDFGNFSWFHRVTNP